MTNKFWKHKIHKKVGEESFREALKYSSSLNETRPSWEWSAQ